MAGVRGGKSNLFWYRRGLVFVYYKLSFFSFYFTKAKLSPEMGGKEGRLWRDMEVKFQGICYRGPQLTPFLINDDAVLSNPCEMHLVINDDIEVYSERQ